MASRRPTGFPFRSGSDDDHHDDFSSHFSETAPLLRATTPPPAPFEESAHAVSQQSDKVAPVQADTQLLEAKTASLAGRSSDLQVEMTNISKECGQVTMRKDIHSVADELSKLSSVLASVDHEANAYRRKKTVAYLEDSSQLLNEMEMCYEEITEFCIDMRSTAVPLADVSWFFDNGRVARLVERLVGMRSVLAAMRGVLGLSRRVPNTCPQIILDKERVMLVKTLSAIQEKLWERHEVVGLEEPAAEIEARARLCRNKCDALIQRLQAIFPDDSTTGPIQAASDTDIKAHDQVFVASKPRFNMRVMPAVHDTIKNTDTEVLASYLTERWITKKEEALFPFNQHPGQPGGPSNFAAETGIELTKTSSSTRQNKPLAPLKRGTQKLNDHHGGSQAVGYCANCGDLWTDHGPEYPLRQPGVIEFVKWAIGVSPKNYCDRPAR